MKKFLFIGIICLFRSFSTFCQNDKEDWKQVELENTMESYKGYIMSYPSGKYSDEAEQKIIEFNNLESVRNSIEWVEIPEGTFIMGSPESEIKLILSSEPQHQVTLNAFKMSKYEITFEQFDKYCDAKGIKKSKIKDEGWGRDSMPVINLTWGDANEFAKWLGCRLPTEAEWEYACRAGTTTPFNTGSNINTSQANFNGFFPYDKSEERGKIGKKTMPVGSFEPNVWGLYDMHGNVAEWCWDWEGNYLITPQINPTGPEVQPIHPKYGPVWHIRRGGSFGSPAKMCRSACRVNLALSIDKTSGFRIVSDK